MHGLVYVHTAPVAPARPGTQPFTWCRFRPRSRSLVRGRCPASAPYRAGCPTATARTARRRSSYGMGGGCAPDHL